MRPLAQIFALALMLAMTGCYGSASYRSGYYPNNGYGSRGYYGNGYYPGPSYYEPPRRYYSNYGGHQTIVVEDRAHDRRMQYDHQRRDRAWEHERRRW